MLAETRPAAVAGSFYANDTQRLQQDVTRLLQGVQRPAALRPKALIVPHAGYVYSGPIAASAYALLAPLRGTIRRVVLFGPAHRVAFGGLALPDVQSFQTPLGSVPLDADAVAQARQLPQVVLNTQAHAAEHSLEVHLPFLQTVLGEFSLVPFCVGRVGAAQVAEVMQALWGGPETLVLVSSDLSHYKPYDAARQIDTASVQAILGYQELTSFDQACGALPINALLHVARGHQLQPSLLDFRNSGDTAGDKAAVVGYASFAFTEPLPASLGDCLLIRARNAIAARFNLPAWPEPTHASLAGAGATFVTLTRNGQLRGCIGSLQAQRVLDADVRANAQAAAFQDPRFPSLSREELDTTQVEVSLLSAPQAMSFSDEADALRQLRPQVDGVIFECGQHRSTFLPQVWEQLPEPVQFIGQLKLKAGLPANFWSPEVRLQRYEVQKWKKLQGR